MRQSSTIALWRGRLLLPRGNQTVTEWPLTGKPESSILPCRQYYRFFTPVFFPWRPAYAKGAVIVRIDKVFLVVFSLGLTLFVPSCAKPQPLAEHTNATTAVTEAPEATEPGHTALRSDAIIGKGGKIYFYNGQNDTYTQLGSNLAKYSPTPSPDKTRILFRADTFDTKDATKQVGIMQTDGNGERIFSIGHAGTGRVMSC
jgi:hypothetical protein